MKVEDFYKIYLEKPNIAINSKKIGNHSLFFALKGKKINGNVFAEEAINNGAAYAVIDESRYKKSSKYILVDNTLKSLHELARYHRNQLSLTVIAVTGTNGKTTTKELIKEVLQTTYPIYATIGNLNNHIGLPLSILEIKDDVKIAVIEMGANHIDEIKLLCQIAQPNYGIITNIGKAHLSGFKNMQGIKKAKGELFEYLSQHKGKIFLNAKNQDVINIAKKFFLLDKQENVIMYGINKKSYCYSEITSTYPFIEIQSHRPFIEITSKLIGAYNADNIMTAVCVGNYFNIKGDLIKQAIENYNPIDNRSQLIKYKSNDYILDAYNANPSSMQHAIDNFEKIFQKNKIVILGDMLELGKYSEKEHLTILLLLKKYNFQKIILVGSEFKKVMHHITCEHFDDVEKLKKWLCQQPYKHCLFLVKGSREIRLENILN